MSYGRLCSGRANRVEEMLAPSPQLPPPHQSLPPQPTTSMFSTCCVVSKCLVVGEIHVQKSEETRHPARNEMASLHLGPTN